MTVFWGHNCLTQSEWSSGFTWWLIWKDTWWFWRRVGSATPWPCTPRSLRRRSHTWFQLTSLKAQSRKQPASINIKFNQHSKQIFGGFEADLKDTILSEEGQQRGFRVCMVFCHLFEEGGEFHDFPKMMFLSNFWKQIPSFKENRL